jgi:aminoglycoside phosphotransferase (APT) family kinase protein
VSQLIRPKLARKEVPRLRETLRDWFARKIPQARDLQLTSLDVPSGGAGFSGANYLVGLCWTIRGEKRSERVVVRAELESANSPESDFEKMLALQKVLGDMEDLPVPRVYWSEHDPAILGGPFYAMQYVEGRVAPDSPPFAASGWVHDASRESRESMYRSGIRFLTRLHALDWQALGLSFLLHKGEASTETRRHLEVLIEIHDRAFEGQRSSSVEAAIGWLRSHSPAAELLAVCWGDCRPGNMLWRNDELAAALDWEMCGLADPAVDLASWAFVDYALTEGEGLRRLPGMLEQDEMVALYEALSGAPLERFVYYEVFAAFRTHVVIAYMVLLWERAGQRLFGPGRSANDSPVAKAFERVVARVV